MATGHRKAFSEQMPELADQPVSHQRALFNQVLIRLRDRGSRGLLFTSFSLSSGVVASFLRGIILAHLLTPREFGLGVILITITGMLDIFADAGLDRFVVQNRFGFREDVLRTSHYFRIVGSLVVALGIVVLAYPLALLFRTPSMFPAIASTGGVVALRGLVDLRYKLQQRVHRFDAEAQIELSRSAVELVVLLSVALIFRSYWAVIVGAYANALTQTLLSHMRDKQPYRLTPRKRLLPLVGRFSTPIYFNAVIAFVAIQGDRLVVAGLFSKTDLAFYTVACAIGQGLTVVLTRLGSIILLPRMTARDQTFEVRRRQVNGICLGVILLSTAFFIGMTIFGPLVTRLAYGAKYHGLLPIIFASSVVNMVQVEQTCAATLLMANAKTLSLPAITIMRASAMPITIVAAKLGAPMTAIPLAFAVGTTLSLAVAYYAILPLKLIDGRLIAISFARTAILIVIGVALAATYPVGG